MRTYSQLPFVEVTSPEFFNDPIEALTRARGAGPLVASSRGVELLSHRLCQATLRDKRVQADHLKLVDEIGIHGGPVLEFKQRMLLGQGMTERRARIRKIMVRYFGPGQAEEMRSSVRRIVHELLDELDGTEPADLWNGLCTLLPARMYCMWVGAPAQDAPLVSRLSDQVLQIFEQNPAATASIVAGYEELFPYVREHIASSRSKRDGTLLAQLIEHADRGELDEDELFDFIVMLLEASTDNTASQLALSIAEILNSRPAWERVKSDRQIIPTAVGESIRCMSRSITNQRYALEDVDIDGVLIPAGTKVNFVSWAAHLDPEAFEDPLTFNVDRKDAARPLTFGGGAFSCLGQHIAEIEIQETVAALAERYPKTEVASFKYELNPFSATATELQLRLR